ncbi:MAG: sugar transferase [Sporocytophaga sp.]|uniref:sugar transferase n=1 Tax=Sporocytophaga sp. TaxID=2231183 RepID=UPI001B068C8C|nr:sugar transferase [Sporocytophaga sp.]MBO9703573.1 sugar transferase [Sporocytophaga sp.]
MKKKYHIFSYVTLDFLAAVIAWLFFFFLRKYILEENGRQFSMLLIRNSLVIGTYWVVFYAFFGFYRDIYQKSRVKEVMLLLTTTFLGCVLVFFILFLDDAGVNRYTAYYKTFVSYFLTQFTLTTIFRVALISRIKKLIKNKKLSFKGIIIGSDKRAKDILLEIQKNASIIGIDVVGFVRVHQENGKEMEQELDHLGSYTNLASIISENKIEHVIIAVEPNEHDRISEILGLLTGKKIRISIIPDVYHLLLGSVKIHQVFGVPLIEINQDLIPLWQKIVKRGVDVVAAIMVLTLGFPFLLFISLMTKYTSKGPIFYLQERIGKDGKPFKIIKFRSMYVNSEMMGPALSSSDDVRITPWGKFMRKTRIDEFPQFFNVLIGEMSLVGPRPERHYFIDQIVKHAPHYIHLHRVRPGITSLGQVKFGYAENVDQMVKRLKYDILYIENMSLAMDFRIILYTVLIMIQGRGK